jgi:hypothetical protein
MILLAVMNEIEEMKKSQHTGPPAKDFPLSHVCVAKSLQLREYHRFGVNNTASTSASQFGTRQHGNDEPQYLLPMFLWHLFGYCKPAPSKCNNKSVTSFTIVCYNAN